MEHIRVVPRAHDSYMAAALRRSAIAISSMEIGTQKLKGRKAKPISFLEDNFFDWKEKEFGPTILLYMAASEI